MGSQREEVERLQLVEYNLTQEIQNTENTIALAPPTPLGVVANMQADEALQETTPILQVTRAEGSHQQETVSVLATT
eukprot:8020730-Prorocentrum_lima.AAC.1